jgi:hypothetical protein
LLEVIKRNQNIRGADVGTGDGSARFTAQAYGDDAVFISECEDGIGQMLNGGEDFTS